MRIRIRIRNSSSNSSSSAAKWKITEITKKWGSLSFFSDIGWSFALACRCFQRCENN